MPSPVNVIMTSRPPRSSAHCSYNCSEHAIEARWRCVGGGSACPGGCLQHGSRCAAGLGMACTMGLPRAGCQHRGASCRHERQGGTHTLLVLEALCFNWWYGAVAAAARGGILQREGAAVKGEGLPKLEERGWEGSKHGWESREWGGSNTTAWGGSMPHALSSSLDFGHTCRGRRGFRHRQGLEPLGLVPPCSSKPGKSIFWCFKCCVCPSDHQPPACHTTLGEAHLPPSPLEGQTCWAARSVR